ncbi:hypothetical protein CYLTODRAFT_425840 [Cylindrobasidium torrendii FP15055 ss-10]|uniref:Uncharacterized protein n=1 Tax=Cylindrobasidium torrendii FP15055 ss-10 TaxID=1314674 RepID=A0A0D7B0S7_9AGAR|nr:hypothetical protein CYLTODRAFT_425840 [Cylindrobasidium torrendii FP15055 ss-10]
MPPSPLLKKVAAAALGIPTVLGGSVCAYLYNKYPPHIPPAESRLYEPNAALRSSQDRIDENAKRERETYCWRDGAVTFYAKVPKSVFGPEPFELGEARRRWEEAFFSAPVMRAERKMLGGRPLGLEVVRPSSASDDLMLKWDMDRDAVGFFEKAAGYGYPWRLPEGGRHDLAVRVAEDGDVLVGFSAAHDYAVLHNDGKRLPPPGEWMHRTFARLLVEDGTRHLCRTKALRVDTSK